MSTSQELSTSHQSFSSKADSLTFLNGKQAFITIKRVFMCTVMERNESKVIKKNRKTKRIAEK